MKPLLDTYVHVLIPELAEKIGVNEALVLNQIHYWLEKSDKLYDGMKWTFNSMDNWKLQFSYLSKPTLERVFSSLKKLGLLITGNYNKKKYDRTTWYTIDYSLLESMNIKLYKASNTDESSSHQIDGMTTSNCGYDPIKLSVPIPNTSTNTTTNINSSSSIKRFKVKRKKKEIFIPSSEPKDKKITTSGKVDINEIYNKYNYQQNKDYYLFDSIIDGIVSILQSDKQYLQDRINNYTESDLLWLSEKLKSCDIKSIPNYIYTRLVNLKGDMQVENNKVDSKPKSTKWKVINVDTEDAREYDDDFYESLYVHNKKKKENNEPNNIQDVLESIRSQLKVV